MYICLDSIQYKFILTQNETGLPSKSRPSMYVRHEKCENMTQLTFFKLVFHLTGPGGKPPKPGKL